MTDKNVEAIVAGGSPIRAQEGVDAHLVERLVRSESVYDGHFLKVRRDQVKLPDGQLAWREHIVHPGAVMIVPLTDDGQLVVERQHRYPLDHVLLEFPAGKLDPDETTLACAKRELLEETGYTAREWAYAGRLHNAQIISMTWPFAAGFWPVTAPLPELLPTRPEPNQSRAASDDLSPSKSRPR